MKSQILIVVALVMSVMAHAQKAAFSSVTFAHVQHRTILRFAVPAEQNVRHYRIEAGKDSADMKVVGMVEAKGNSVMPLVYSYTVTPAEYAYYRVAKVEMNGQMPYSAVVQEKADDAMRQPIENALPCAHRGAIVVR